ncbi:MAG: nucleotidyltransferase [Epsilonproteobacteria bacterium]|nr:nucleotidyltransferase [Campylobacterota bacterium]
MTKEDVIKSLQKNKKRFLEKYDISKIILFGSYARGENRDNSDVDIAVETKTSDYFVLFDLKEELEKLLHTKVDLVRLRDKMNEALKKRILKEGIYV